MFLRRHFWPFSLFIDASSADVYTRAAAYRHNRSVRAQLPRYLVNWLFSSGIALAVSAHFQTLAAQTGHAKKIYDVVAAGFGAIFAAGSCAFSLIGFVYLYLGRRER